MTLSMQEWIFTESFGRYTIDLGDSNVTPLSAADLLGPDALRELARLPLGYGHEAGLPELRAAIAARHARAGPESVLVAHGAQEAFSLLIRALDRPPRSEAIVVGSGWSQHSALPAEEGMKVVTVPLAEDEEALLAAVAKAATWRTGAIVVASPDNPTGWSASPALLEALSEIAGSYDALLIVDEEYVIDGERSVAGLNESVAVVSGLSKLHGLPGLRIGWCVARPELIARCTRRKHLSTIANSVLCERLALAVLADDAAFRRRAATLCGAGRAVLRAWAAERGTVEVLGSGEELPFAWLRLAAGTDSLAVARAALRGGVLVIPGEVFDRPGHLRVTVGRDPAELRAGLAVLTDALADPAAVRQAA
ncbi:MULTISPECIES: pyridoxal phosphate-dependent aminotransferase [Streptomyces]|uniref:Aminotransferase n=1 Tax=Streptomyces ramulosus TaxID=47762 RepID=A0ABW1FRY1_9ACTN